MIFGSVKLFSLDSSMANIAAYLHDRQYGLRPKVGCSKSVKDYVEKKFTESFVNKVYTLQNIVI